MKKLVVTLLAGAMVFGLAAPTFAAEYDASGDEKVTLVWSGNCVAADIHAQAMHVFAEKVEEYSGGSVTCDVYTDSTLYSSENELQALLDNDIQVCYLSFPTMATQVPSYEMFAAGYFWKDYDHMTSTLNSDFATEKVFAAAEEAMGIKVLGASYLGSRVVNTRETEINSYADMAGLLLRMPNSEAWMDLGKALGAEPTPLAFSELYTALQTGAVEGQDNPLPSNKNAAFYEVTKYMAITNHVVDSVMISFNQEAWDELTEAQQMAVEDAVADCVAFNDEKRIQEEADCIAFFEEAGLTVTYPDVNEFKENVTNYYFENELTGNWDMELYEEIQALAK